MVCGSSKKVILTFFKEGVFHLNHVYLSFLDQSQLERVVIWSNFLIEIGQGSMCYMPGGIQPSAVGIQRRFLKARLTCCSLPPGFWRLSYLDLPGGINPAMGHLETVTGQGCRGKVRVLCPPPPILFFRNLPLSLSLLLFKPFSQIQCCRSQPYIHTTIYLLRETKEKKIDGKD